MAFNLPHSFEERHHDTDYDTAERHNNIEGSTSVVGANPEYSGQYLDLSNPEAFF